VVLVGPDRKTVRQFRPVFFHDRSRSRVFKVVETQYIIRRETYELKLCGKVGCNRGRDVIALVARANNFVAIEDYPSVIISIVLSSAERIACGTAAHERREFHVARTDYAAATVLARASALHETLTSRWGTNDGGRSSMPEQKMVCVPPPLFTVTPNRSGVKRG